MARLGPATCKGCCSLAQCTGAAGLGVQGFIGSVSKALLAGAGKWCEPYALFRDGLEPNFPATETATKLVPKVQALLRTLTSEQASALCAVCFCSLCCLSSHRCC